MPDTVRVATDAEGRVADTSILTYGDVTIPVPGWGVTRMAPHRIWAAMETAGVRPATNYYDDITSGDGYVDIAVRPRRGVLMAVDITVHPVTEDGEVTGFEYRCSFCNRVGVGYASRPAALNDAARHRCQDRAWNETKKEQA